MQERTGLENSIKDVRSLEVELEDTITLIELGETESDSEVIVEGELALKKLKARAAKAELESLLSGEADANDCFLEIHAGAGGTESQDWAQMLSRMYIRWAEGRGYKVEYLEESPGDEAGLKSLTLKILGRNSYGWLKTESGVHRLVRISPYCLLYTSDAADE